MPDIYRDIINLWQSCQGGEFGGQILPDAGGMLDQLNWLTEAFSIISIAFHTMRKEKRHGE